VSAQDVLEVIGWLRQASITAWVDGGWGVDALIGRQTRPHQDLDLVVDERSLEALLDLLMAKGFAIEHDRLPTAIVTRHPDGRSIDLHPVSLTPDGGGDQVQPDGTSWHSGPPTTGNIDLMAVPCCDVDTQLRAHVGYEPDATDRADITALAEAFACELPEPYR
jgi:lincosamide nucleotidyltransferase A/C/D/E